MTESIPIWGTRITWRQYLSTGAWAVLGARLLHPTHWRTKPAASVWWTTDSGGSDPHLFGCAFGQAEEGGHGGR